jgi:serine/threonine-protein kinase
LDRRIPLDLETICLKAIQKELNDRYSTAGEMAEDLRRYLDDVPVVASRSSLVRRGWRWVRRRPAVVAAAILTIVTLLSLGTAAMFVERANSVIGLRSVRITSEPPGANVRFAPLDEISGEPIAGQCVLASGRSPVDTDLRPGDYLVVAVLADGRFHEVYRHVPRPDESLPGIHRHNRWTIRGNTVELPTIVIPELSTTDGMAYIGGSRFVTEAGSIAANNGPHSTKVRSFYIDATEFTVSESVGGSGDDKPNDSRLRGRMMNAAANVSFDEATALAELAGKRLPTEAEFEFATTSGGRYRFPWGDASVDNAAANEVAEFGPVGFPNFDVLKADRLVFGLCSNVAEWTSSKPHPSSTDLAGVRLDSNLASDYRVVKGGDRRVVEGMPAVSTEHRNPRDSVGVSRYYVKPGLGFRCVRTAKPRIGPDEL